MSRYYGTWICDKCGHQTEKESYESPRLCHGCCTFDGLWLSEKEQAEKEYIFIHGHKPEQERPEVGSGGLRGR